jgi:hypothetical protein
MMLRGKVARYCRLVRIRLEGAFLRRAVALLGVASLIALSGCALNGLAFKQDQRLRFTQPSYRQKVHLPFTIRWTLTDFELTGRDGQASENAGSLEVLFDTGPQPPGQGLRYFARNDPSCRASEGCPDQSYLAQRGIFTTTDDSLTVRHLPPAPGVDLSRGQPDIHDVTIVLLNGKGERIGESSWSTTFEILHD